MSTMANAGSEAGIDTSGQSEEVPKHQCTQCSRSYKRIEHLHRHLQAHSQNRPYHCDLCKASFQRSDVLKRHRKTCDGKRRRISIARRVCNACAYSKRACDLQSPCGECLRKNISCVPADAAGPAYGLAATTIPDDGYLFAAPMPNYEDVLTQPFLLSDFTGTFDFSNTIPNSLIMTEMATREQPTLSFLERFTSRSGLVDSFDCGTPESRAQCYAWLVSKTTDANSRDMLADKSREIVALVEEVVTIRPRNSAVVLTWCDEVEGLCKHFFSPQKLQLYLSLYFAMWAPNVSFLHYPSFQAETSKAVLLAAMAVIGATVSPDECDNISARMWFSCVEEMVFQDDDFCTDHQVQVLPSPGRVQALQAAYMVCLYQNWNGNDVSKRRIRRFRFNTLISVARDFGMELARHLPLASIESFSWKEFYLREQLIRTLLWVFLLDTAFVIFHNSPPRIAIMEMKLQLGCNEGAFQARTSDECYHFLQEQNANDLLLSSMTALLCHGPLDILTQERLSNLGPFNLFVLTSALHSSIFQVQQSFGYEIHMWPIHNALDNWILLWQLYSSGHAETERHSPLGTIDIVEPEVMWRRIGFSRFAAEYWLLAKLITQRIGEAAQKRREAQLPFEAMVSHDAHLVNHDPDPSQLKYDETSMRQVNEMISHFQKVVIK